MGIVFVFQVRLVVIWDVSFVSQVEEKKLESEVVKLQDPDYMARYAREKFGYTKDGELILRVENKDKSSSSSDSTEENVIKEDN